MTGLGPGTFLCLNPVNSPQLEASMSTERRKCVALHLENQGGLAGKSQAIEIRSYQKRNHENSIRVLKHSVRSYYTFKNTQQ